MRLETCIPTPPVLCSTASPEMEKSTVLMSRYELGRLLGQGNFAKVYHGRKIATGKSVAIKVIDKEKVQQVGMIEQIKREISVMHLVRHPNIVQLYEVMASKRKIYFVMEHVKGGELFDKVAKGRLKEDAARKYFQQLIAAADFCHSRGVYHRDLKPENLLLDEEGNLKVSDFGLSALGESRRKDGLLHTTCGTPAYVAPEIITKKGYDGAKADIWSCGVILFVLLAGYLPFQDSNLMELYKKIIKGEFRCPSIFPPDVRDLLPRLLDPNPSTRITIDKLVQHPWFKKGFTMPKMSTQLKNSISMKDMQLNFSSDVEEEGDSHGETSGALKPASLNAFGLISRSSGFDLSGLFGDKKQKAEARFMTEKPASTIVTKLEQLAQTENFYVKKNNGTVQLQGTKEGRKGQLAIDADIYEVAPSLCVVEVTKSSGDTIEYQDFCNKDLKPTLKDISWAS